MKLVRLAISKFTLDESWRAEKILSNTTGSADIDTKLWDAICGWLDLADAKILRAQIAGSGILDIVSQIGIGQG